MRKSSSGIGSSSFPPEDINATVAAVNAGTLTLLRKANQLQVVTSALTAGQAFTVNLPAAPAAGDEVCVKVIGDPATATATVTVSGAGNLIDRAATAVVSTVDDECGCYLFDGTQWADLTKSSA